MLTLVFLLDEWTISWTIKQGSIVILYVAVTWRSGSTMVCVQTLGRNSWLRWMGLRCSEGTAPTGPQATLCDPSPLSLPCYRMCWRKPLCVARLSTCFAFAPRRYWKCTLDIVQFLDQGIMINVIKQFALFYVPLHLYGKGHLYERIYSHTTPVLNALIVSSCSIIWWQGTTTSQPCSCVCQERSWHTCRDSVRCMLPTWTT